MKTKLNDTMAPYTNQYFFFVFYVHPVNKHLHSKNLYDSMFNGKGI